MKAFISCTYNMDNCCVELKFADGSMIAIDTIAVENEVADNMYLRSPLAYLKKLLEAGIDFDVVAFICISPAEIWSLSA